MLIFMLYNFRLKNSGTLWKITVAEFVLRLTEDYSYVHFCKIKGQSGVFALLICWGFSFFLFFFTMGVKPKHKNLQTQRLFAGVMLAGNM